MQVYEIAGFQSGVARDTVNFLEPSDSFQNINNGYIYRQVLKSRKGFSQFASGPVTDGTRIMGIFEHILQSGLTELLVISKERLYKYDTTTNAFVVIPMAGAAPAAFTITNNYDYVSGTTYPFKDGSDRFIFCGAGLDSIYQYDGTDVTVFNNVADNPDYVAPAGGALTKASFCISFGQRLNLLNPIIAGLPGPQEILFTGINDSSGSGDDFNTPGAGSVVADTSEYINGLSRLGDRVMVAFNRSSWSLEKTRDAFNPYFFRKIPSVLGTDAGFSVVEWANRVESIGKTGVIGTNGQEQARVDNKIPLFTADEINSSDIELTYGGFDRDNAQYMFSYKSAASEEDTQDKVLIHNYEEDTWSVYDMRFTCFGQTILGLEVAWDDIDENISPSWISWQTTEESWNKIGQTATLQKTLAGDDNGYIYYLNQDYDDYTKPIAGITNASQAVITVGSAGYEIGDMVVISGVEGMTEINNFDDSTDPTTFIPYEVVAKAATTVTVNFNSTNAGTYTTAGLISKPINFSAETVPFNPWRSEGKLVYVSHVEFLINTDGGFVRLDIYEDEETTPFKKNVLLKPTSTRKAREWVNVVVNQESNFLTFKMSQLSPAVELSITSIRIHCKPGGMTSD